MKPVFGDTVYFLALLNPADQWHSRARTLSQTPRGTMLTTEFVLMEVGDALSAPVNRPQFARFLGLLKSRADIEIVPATSELFQKGCALHAQRPDKDWSVTDCTSFVVMQQRGLQDALTSDRHFEQSGFRLLM